MRKYVPWLLRLLGPGLLLLFLLTSDLNELATNLREADPWPIVWSLLLLPPFLLVKSWRWQYLMRELGVRVPFGQCVALYNIGIYLGAVTPGQAGDLVKAWYLRERGHALAPALLSVMLDRLCDLLVMASLAVLGIIAVGEGLGWLSPQMQLVIVLAMGVTLLALTVLLAARGPREWLLTGLLPRLLPQRLHASLLHWSEQFATLSITPRLVLLAGSASLVSAAFTFYRLWLLFVALAVFVPLHVVVGVSALIAILQVLPISIGGVGVRDAALIAVLAPYAYTQEHALAVSALFLLLTLEHILVGFLVSLWFPVRLPDQQQAAQMGATVEAEPSSASADVPLPAEDSHERPPREGRPPSPAD